VIFGRFRFLNLGDLIGQPLFKLTCPKTLIGSVYVYEVTHHGGADDANPAIFAAFSPRVAIMNNGLKKGGALGTYKALHQVHGLEDVWQLHRSDTAGDENFAVERIANLDESTADWIKISASEDGSFRVLNGRTARWKSYSARSARNCPPVWAARHTDRVHGAVESLAPHRFKASSNTASKRDQLFMRASLLPAVLPPMLPSVGYLGSSMGTGGPKTP
jgi:hypothetical protein